MDSFVGDVKADKARKASEARWKQKQRITETTSNETTSNTHRIGHIPISIPAQNFHDVRKNATLSSFMDEEEGDGLD